LAHDYPGNAFIKSEFASELLHAKQVYVDEEVHVRNARVIAVLCGRCTGELLFDGLSSCTVYVRHDGDVTVDCGGLSKVFVSVHDGARVRVRQAGGAAVYVYAHGDACTVETDGDVNVRKTEK
jgi:hypothetical protein